MRLATIITDKMEKLTICSSKGLVTMEDLNKHQKTQWPERMDTLIKLGQLEPLHEWYGSGGQREIDGWNEGILGEGAFQYSPLYRTPPKIWGIGLNYVAHAQDLAERAPTGAPASFMKPATAIIGYGDLIMIPHLSERTTAEAELGLVIGKRCKDVPKENWLDVVAGFTTIIDMTAEDILRRNPRYLTMCKSFDTFFSFGPQLVTTDEIEDVLTLKVTTVINGKVHAENTVDHMTFPPDELVSYHSSVMTLMPGDIISTGTPGATPIQDGDEVECRINGFEALNN
ncbi:MAG: fumarylacetoacetate hydrolase family protein, partial [Deltaproteobacteria bacterium]|nr:fumarylacetoacetate hydrolase family protein [Deltaproteobacteria bacterium]